MPSASAPSKVAERAKPEGAIALCGAKTKSREGTCRSVAGAGTDHLGYGHCKLHGGNTPGGQMFAARLEADALALDYQVEPHEALLRAVGQAAKWELTTRLKVAALDDADLAVRHVRRREWEGTSQQTATQGGGSETIEESHADLNVWVKAHLQAVRDLAGIAKTAIDAGVEERRVRLAEQLGGELGDLFAAVFAQLKLSVDQQQRAPAIVRRQLELLEGGSPVETAAA